MVLSQDKTYLIDSMIADQGYSNTLRACEQSLRRLGLSYVDFYLIHWPVQGLGNDTWHDLVVIPKSIHQDRILENSKVFDFQLEQDDMKLLDSMNEDL